MSEQSEEGRQAATTWSGIAERGSMGALRFIRWFYETLGRRATIAFLTPVVTYFFVTGRVLRRASIDYLRTLCDEGAKRKYGSRERPRTTTVLPL